MGTHEPCWGGTGRSGGPSTAPAAGCAKGREPPESGRDPAPRAPGPHAANRTPPPTRPGTGAAEDWGLGPSRQDTCSKAEGEPPRPEGNRASGPGSVVRPAWGGLGGLRGRGSGREQGSGPASEASVSARALLPSWDPCGLPFTGAGRTGVCTAGPHLVPGQQAHPQGPGAAPEGALTCILTAITTEMSSFSSSLKTTSFFKVRLHNL